MPRTARELAEALAAAHAKGVTHRDFKPENVMRDPTAGSRCSTSAWRASPSRRSVAGGSALNGDAGWTWVGTPAYMAPEQLNGQPADARTDVFAFGVVSTNTPAARIRSRRRPRSALVARVLESDARPIADRVRQIPPGVAAVVDRCLRKSPDDRFASAAEIVAALKAGAGGQASRAIATAGGRAGDVVATRIN